MPHLCLPRFFLLIEGVAKDRDWVVDISTSNSGGRGSIYELRVWLS
jgi:hypothetical protein